MICFHSKGCCTASELYFASFGSLTEGEKQNLLIELKNLKKGLNFYTKKKVVIAYLTRRQLRVRNFLKSLGFKSTKAMSGQHHPEKENDLFLMWLPMETYNPKDDEEKAI